MYCLIRTAVALLLLALPAPIGSAQENGKFVGELKYKPIGGGTHEVLEYFEYVAPDGTKWGVPEGTLTDGASIPQVLWSLVGSPFTGNYIKAAVVHDYYCDTKTRPWQEVHRAFYHGMLAGGEDAGRAKLMYLAVYYRGPRWTTEVARENKRSCQQLESKDGRARTVCRVARVERRTHNIIEFPRPTAGVLGQAPSASEIQSLLSSVENSTKVERLSLAEIEAKADRAWDELKSLPR